MTIRGPGDSVPIKTRLDDGTLLSDRFVITYFDPERSLLYTCGHCFPSNASLQRPDGELVSTSGYMDADRDEGVEVAVVLIWKTPFDSDPLCATGRSSSSAAGSFRPEQSFTFIAKARRSRARSLGDCPAVESCTRTSSTASRTCRA